MDQKLPDKSCPNCGTSFQQGNAFCSHCGQKVEIIKIRFSEMLKVFFYSLFNADSSLWRTLRHIWIPGKLTTEYFSGRRKSYFHPARLFFFSWVLFFAVFAVGERVDMEIPATSNLFQHFEKRVQSKKTLTKLLEKRDEWALVSSDSLFVAGLDDLVLSSAHTIRPEWNPTDIDSLKGLLKSERDSISVIVVDPEFQLRISYEDLVTLSDEELFEEYGIEGFLNRVISKQAMKIFRDTTGMIQYLTRGVSWMVLFVIPVMAFLLYVLYFYRKHYLVEHLVFLLHAHAFLFVSFLVVRLIDWIVNSFLGLTSIEPLSFLLFYILALIFSILHPVIGLRVYYKSSIAGVLIKGPFLILSYFFIAVIGFLLAMIVRFLLF